jgi:intein/homing endonuclease
VQGDPIVLDDEWLAFIVAAYALDPVTGRRKVDAAVLSRPKGRAKALALDTPIPTPDGWTTIGAVEPGDTVFDEVGQLTTVLGVSEVFVGHDCFEVEFSDGERIVADAGHLWTVEELRKEYRTVTVDTAYLAEHRTTRADAACNFRLQMPGALALPTADLPIDPYVLGVWLGDGNTRGASVTLADEEVVEQLRSAGYRVEHRPSYGPYGHWVFGLRPQLRGAGVLGNKHVPERYLRASAEQRLALLQGLMDTDGTIGPEGRAGFTSTLEHLVDAVVELLATFGIKGAKREFRTKMNGRDCGPGWLVDFWPVAEIPVFRLPRKAERQRPRDPFARSRLADTRRIVGVTPVASVPTRCIAVDSPSHLFLAGRRMVQTHNSELAGFLVVAEAFGPTRFDGWDADGQPVGRRVRSPLIKCLATEEEQAGNTFENVAYIAADWGPDVHPDLYGGVRGAKQYQSASALYLPFGGEIRAATSGAASKDGGKEPLALDTPVLTTGGWRTVGTLEPGDHVFGPDGQPVLVYGKTPVKYGRPCYRVTFDDGGSVVTDHRHSWTVFDRWRAGSARHREDGFEPWRTLTTEQLLRLSLRLRDGSPKDRGFKRFGLPWGSAVDLPKKDLPLDPYVLGLWLGDGDARVATIAMGDEDRPELVGILHDLGFTTSEYNYGSGCPVVRFNHGARYGKAGTSQHALRDLGVLGNKHVPEDYLLGSVDQRLALLQGLMDSDGSSSERGNCVFVNKDRGLCEAVTALVRSLGWRTTGVSVWKSDARWKVATGNYRVSFTPHGPWAPFRLRRKAQRCRTEVSTKMKLRTIVSIEPVDSVPVACVAVDSDDHLFLVGESLIPTHNTFAEEYVCHGGPQLGQAEAV